MKTDSIRKVIELLNNEEKTKRFTINSKEQNNHSVHTTDIETHTNIQKALKANGVEFYTFSTNNKRNKLLVLKGLNSAYTTEEVHEELTHLLSKENINIVKVDKLLPSNHTNNHLLVQLQPESDTRIVTRIKSIAHQRVHWELYRKNKVFQCFNCQRVGHSSSNCNLQYRCVKCIEQHAPGECQLHLQPEEQKQPKCVNCNENHPANYRGCKYIKEAQDIIKHRKAAATSKRIETGSKYRENTKIHHNPLQTQHINTKQHQPCSTYNQAFPPLNTVPKTNNNLDPASNPTHNSEITDIKNLISGLSTEVTKAFAQQTANLETFKNTFIEKVETNTSKIDFLYHKLNLQWP